MPTEDAGKPIRSEDLDRHRRDAESRFEAANQTAQEANRRVRMASLAMRAQEPVSPPEKSPGNEHTLIRKPIAGTGAAHVGPFVTARTINRQLRVSDRDLQGSGNLDILRPGAIWAGLHENRTAVFEARLEPARLIEYNEIMIPHIAGQVSLQLFNDRNQYRIGSIEESRLVRLSTPQPFNGRVRLESKSSATAPDGRYIHTIGGLSLYNSDWASSAKLMTEFQAPESGEVTDVEARLWPGKESPPVAIYVDENEKSLPFSIDKGTTVKLKMDSVDGKTAASLVKINCSIL